MDDELLDDDGYPSDATLDRIKTWPIAKHDDARALLDFVRDAWNYADIGYWQVQPADEKTFGPHTDYLLSTGGWSGNEDIVDALRGNDLFWILCWQQHTRGGHFVFRFPEKGSVSRGS